MQQSWTVKHSGTPGEVADRIEAEVRGAHHAAQDAEGWVFGLRTIVAHAAAYAIRHIGNNLVARDVGIRTDARTGRIAAWRNMVEQKRALYDALPENEKKGFVAPAEPDWGPLPKPLPIGAQCDGSADDEGITGFALNVTLAPEA